MRSCGALALVLLALGACASEGKGEALGADARAEAPGDGSVRLDAEAPASENDGSAPAASAEDASAPDARSNDGPGLDAGRSDAAALGDAGGITRRYRLATTGAQLLVTGPALGLQLTEADVATDSDVMAVHQEFYGVPWEAFESGASPPAEWASLMQRLADSAVRAERPVFLSISMLNGKRESLAAKTRIEQGQVKSDDDWSAKCYDFARAPDAAQKRAAYLRYVAYMIERFRPAYLNVAIEVNLFFEKCPAATAGLIALLNDVYRAAKKQRPETLVFPSFQIDHLYGFTDDSCPSPAQRDQCFDAAYAVIAPILRDRFAMSTYPYMPGISAPANVPADWFRKGAARAGEVALIAETGWPSTPIVLRSKDDRCSTFLSFDETISAAYLKRVLDEARSGSVELVTWWSNRDLLVEPLMTDCPCRFDATWCSVLDLFRGPAPTGSVDTQLFGELLLKVFGTMGLRRYGGSPKAQHLALWNAARAAPYAP